jgi:N6-adenosine-specific RNA methylase IME4
MSTAVVVPFAPSPRDAWVADGLRLSHSAKSVMFEIGDWWNNPPVGVHRLAEVRSEAWRTGGGLSYGACRVAGSVAERWPVLSRDNRLSFHHYRFVAKLPDEHAVPLLQWCLQAPEPRGPQELNARVKQIKRDAREVALADRIRQESAKVGLQRYGVVYADPPWRFAPYSRVTGMDRAAANHYPTMTIEKLFELDVSAWAASDCALFLWATVAMMDKALDLMAEWGFVYRSAYGWLKPGPGHGYWSQRDQLELLLVGVRGEVPAPAPGTQPPQVLIIERGRHSAKPDAFAGMIERMFPTVAKLEMFARGLRAGWDTWGAEAEYPER